MNRDPSSHHRRSIRLSGFDYAGAGMYFITVCTQDDKLLFGEVAGGKVALNDAGKIVESEWLRTSQMRPTVTLDAFVVMPNHLHGIIVLSDDDPQPGRGTLQRAPTVERFGKPTSNSIPTIVRLFKSATAKRINEQRNTPGAPVWQRNYYEHVIRNDASLGRIREYIVNNPRRWANDRENPMVAAETSGEAWQQISRILQEFGR